MTGYGLSEWIVRWQTWLVLEEPPPRAKSMVAAGRPELARERLGELDDLDGPHAGWFALRGRFDAEAGATAAAAKASEMALSLDPWSEMVACEGHLSGLLGADPWQLREPADARRKQLCLTARARPQVQ